jgi:hypothetical protein
VRNLPPDLEMAPLPDDFTIALKDDGRVIRWDGSIPGAAGSYQLGLRPPRTDKALTEAAEMIRNGVWQLYEFARLGRPDLMQYAARDRHKKRPGPQRRLDPATLQQAQRPV